MKEFTKDVIEQIGNYVYRLIDPRDFQTFYVGRGVNNRVFQHAKDAIKKYEDGEDAVSMKIKQIQDIINSGKEVICVIHRYGMTKEQAMEVEAALIDCYPGLTNLVSGYGSDRGVITADELQNKYKRPVYEEPDIDYVIIKTSNSAVTSNGRYNATRRAWRANLDRAKGIKYALSVIDGVVGEVYEVSRWYECPEISGRIEFEGAPAPEKIRTLFINKLIPDCYRQKGMSSPFLYKKKHD